jgi:hypothetical protein
MVDITAIGVVANSLNRAVNIAKAMIDVRDATTFQRKVFELQRAIIDAQQSVFAVGMPRMQNRDKDRICSMAYPAKAMIAQNR